MNRGLNYIIISSLISILAKSQDTHFSQFFSSPQFLNPAAVGNFKEDFRLSSNYKDQWRTISQTYKTIFASAEIAILKVKTKGNYLGIGMLFYNDRAGRTSMATNQFGLSLAYNVKMNKYNFLAAGIGGGFVQKNLNTSGLRWDNQFNGNNYDPNLTSGEPATIGNANALDISGGFLWNFVPNEKNNLSIGISLLHANKPNVSFYKTPEYFLDPKVAVNINGILKVGKKNMSFLPLILLTNQGKLLELNGGGMIKYELGMESRYTGSKKNSSISAGATYRLNDALIFLFLLDYNSTFKFGFSYDVNISKLAISSKGRGGAELFLGYSGLFKN